MAEFAVKPRIVYGQEAAAHIDALQFQKVCIATDQKIIDLGLVKPLTDQLDAQGIAYEIFSEIFPDPTTETIEKGLLHIIHSRPDALIAVGGGSVIDTAKAVIYYCIKFKESFVDVKSIHKPFFAAIPTTAGTGSEATSYAVITNSATKVKTPITSDLMLPDLVILDPIFTKSAPAFITAETGMDALTHGIEAYVSKMANEFSDAYALKAIKLIYENLLMCCKDGDNLVKREKLQIASCMAGIAFNNASLGINHSLAHTLGANFKISHGRANAMILPFVMAYNQSSSLTQKRYSEIASHLGLEFNDEQINAQALIESIKLLNKAIGIPANLREYGVEHEAVMGAIDTLAQDALQDLCTYGNPVQPSLEDLRGILLKLV